MSHELYEADHMVYVGETPWHKLGVKVESIRELPSILDWRIVKRDVYVAGKDGNERGRKAEAYCGLVRSGDGKIMAVMGSDYEPHQNRDIWSKLFAPFVEAGELVAETAGMLQDGNRIWLLARIPKASFDLGNDRNDGFVLCATSHDGSLSTVAKPTAVRVVCQNTLSMATSNLNGAFKQKHTSALRVNQAKEVVASACASFSAHKAQAQRLKATPVTPLQLGTFVAELVQPELLTKVSTELGTADTTNNSVRLTVNEILNQTKWQRVFDRLLHDEGSRTTHALVEAIPKQRGGFDRTAWGLAQGVSYWTDHVRGRTADSRLNSAWFGPSDALKREAFALADSYAERQAA